MEEIDSIVIVVVLKDNLDEAMVAYYSSCFRVFGIQFRHC